MAAGQAAEAVSWFRRVLDGRASMLGPDHPGAIAAKVSLGRALVAVGQPGDAVAILEEAVAGSELVRGARPSRYPRRTGRVRRRGPGRGKARRGDPRVPALAGRPGAHSGPAASRHHDRQPGAGRRLPGGRPDQGRHLPVQASSHRPGRPARLGPSGHTQGPREPRIGPLRRLRMASALQLYEETCKGYERTIGADHPTTLAYLAGVILAGGAGALYVSQSSFSSVSADIAGLSSGVFSSMVNMAGQVGGAVTASLTPWVAQRFGWTTSFAIAATLAAVGGVLWMTVHPERPLNA